MAEESDLGPKDGEKLRLPVVCRLVLMASWARDGMSPATPVRIPIAVGGSWIGGGGGVGA